MRQADFFVKIGFKLGDNKKSAPKSAFVARDGFEPPQAVPKTAVLPLDDRAIEGANIMRYVHNAKLILGVIFVLGVLF